MLRTSSEADGNQDISSRLEEELFDGRLLLVVSRSYSAGNRQEATAEARTIDQLRIDKAVLEQQQLPLYLLLHYKRENLGQTYTLGTFTLCNTTACTFTLML